MTIQLTQAESERYRFYNVPNSTTFTRVKLNVINLNKHNSLQHEMKKLELGYISSKFITEAERKGFKVGEGETKIVDFVDLVTGLEYEIIDKHESDFEIQSYRKFGVIPIIVGEKIVCRFCNKIYPKRKKDNICQVCSKEMKK